MSPDDWERVPEGSKRYVLRLVRALADGFTGEVKIECKQGGVSRYYETRMIGPGDLKHEAA